jgi:hypothetical protein
VRRPAFMPHLSGFEVHALQIAADRIDLQVVASQPRAPCPVCQRPSARVHSRYERHIADLPWSGTPLIHSGVDRLSGPRSAMSSPACGCSFNDLRPASTLTFWTAGWVTRP